MVRSTDGTESTLKTGLTLNAGEVIIASGGAYIGLMNSSGGTIQVREEGEYSVDDLERQSRKVSGSIARRYVKYMVDKLNAPAPKKSEITPAVSRDISLGITLLIPSSAEAIGNKALVSWKAPEDVKPNFNVVIKNLFDDEIASFQTSEYSMILDFEELDNETGIYIMMVSSIERAEINSGRIGIKKLEPDDRPDVYQHLESLSAEINEDDNPLNKLIFASFYEDNDLLLDAVSKYEEAIQMAPEISGFRELYESFLVKYGVLE